MCRSGATRTARAERRRYGEADDLDTPSVSPPMVSRMKAFGCIVLFVVLSGSACASGDDNAASAAETGTPEAFCPLMVDFAVESELAGSALGDSAGEAINGPEFARSLELLGELIEAAPPRVRELVEAASFEPDDGEVVDEDAARAMWMAIADLPASCTGDQTAQCTDRLATLRQETSPAAFTDAELSSLAEVCSAAPYLAGADKCDTLALAILHDEGDSELPILEHFLEHCE